MKIFKTILKRKKELLIITLLTLISRLLSQGIPTIIKFLSDNLINYNIKIIFLLTTSIIFIGFIKYFTTLYSDKFYYIYTNSIGLDLIKKFINTLLYNDKKIFNTFKPDELSRIATSDMQQLKDKILQYYFILICTIFEVVSLLFFVMILDYKLGLITITWYTLYYLISKCFVDRITKDRKIERESYTNIISFTKDTIYGNFDLKYYLNFNGFSQKLETIYNTYNRNYVTLMVTNSMSKYLTHIGTFINICIIFIYKAFFVKDVTTGTLLAMFMYSNNYAGIFRNVIALRTILKDIKILRTPVERFYKFIQINTKKNFRMINDIQKIRLDGVCIAFDKLKVITNISCEFHKNHIYIITGDSGSGKTSIINALLGEIEYSGSIYINNYLLDEVERQCIFDRIGVIRQEIYLLNMTIGENITLFKSDYSEKELCEITDMVRINNIDHKITSSEISTVSGGERKRIALARLLMRIDEKDVIILDETFANIDIETSKIIINYLMSKMNEKILIIVSHNNDIINTICKYSNVIKINL